jgi:HlyD family secretion protein
MQTRTKVLIGILAVVVLGTAAALSVAHARNNGIGVRMAEVDRRDLVQVVTASGNIRAHRKVDISSDISAKVDTVLVKEGDDVRAGQVLLRLDPAQSEAARSRAQAALSQSRAQESQQQANLARAQRDLDRFLSLNARDSLLVSPQQIDDARTTLDVAKANLKAAQFGVSQAQASLDEAQDMLSKTVITAPIAGKVTRLNVDQGETVVIGTMNNPGSLILTVSDLSVIEAVVQVDETDVPEVVLGDSAVVHIDAFPDRTFTGKVTEIGNSAIQPPSQQTTGQQAAIDFEVVITLDSTNADLRPDLSATADIVTARRSHVLAVPIIALTVKEKADSAAASADSSSVGQDARANDTEGVYVVHDGKVKFSPVKVGITGREYFEILSGVEQGDTVVSGPYQKIRELKDGDAVKPLPESTAAPAASTK